MSISGRDSTAAMLVRTGFVVVLVPVNVSGFRPVLARGRHGARLSGLFVPKPSSRVAVLVHVMPDLLGNVRQRPQASEHERVGRHSVRASRR
jgi:hypothetical protein